MLFGVLLAWYPGPTSAYWLPASVVLVANLFANWLFVRALATGDFSRTVPLLSLTPAFAALFGWLILGETLLLRQIAGVGLVVVGAIVLVGKRGSAAPGGKPVAALSMVMVALLWGLNAPFDKAAAEHSSVPFHAFFQGAGLALIFITALRWTGRIGEFVRAGPFLPALSFAAVIGALALGLQLAAFTLMDVALVETIKRVTGLVLALILGRWLFSEAVSPRKVIAGGLMASGLPLALFP